jgi:hypothetical protein
MCCCSNILTFWRVSQRPKTRKKLLKLFWCRKILGSQYQRVDTVGSAATFTTAQLLMFIFAFKVIQPILAFYLALWQWWSSSSRGCVCEPWASCLRVHACTHGGPAPSLVLPHRHETQNTLGFVVLNRAYPNPPLFSSPSPPHACTVQLVHSSTT